MFHDLWTHYFVLLFCVVSVMANYFVVFCFLLVTSALGPTVWYLWIYCNSANANFYFGATLAFASAQVSVPSILIDFDIGCSHLWPSFLSDIPGDRFIICVQ